VKAHSRMQYYDVITNLSWRKAADLKIVKSAYRSENDLTMILIHWIRHSLHVIVTVIKMI